MKLRHITQYLESIAPIAYQESYDNSGLIVGNPEAEVQGVMLSLDVTETIIIEAKEHGCNLIISHHPIVFKGLKRLTGANYVERVVAQAIREDIALYAIHTNLDNVAQGVNRRIAERLGLENIKVLAPKAQVLQKLVVFVPQTHTQQVLEALGAAGAGQIGEYSNCSFRVAGTGTFTPSAIAKPYIGQAHQPEEVAEDRLELILPAHAQGRILAAMRAAHPYEEIAYYLQNIENQHQDVGSGAIGELPQAMTESEFLRHLCVRMEAKVVRHTALLGKPIKRVALCGGTGSFLLGAARRAGAEVFVSADFKYHEFFDAEGKMLIADIGHYETEHFTTDLLLERLQVQFPEMKIIPTRLSTNPIEYFCV